MKVIELEIAEEAYEVIEEHVLSDRVSGHKSVEEFMSAMLAQALGPILVHRPNASALALLAERERIEQQLTALQALYVVAREAKSK